VLGGIVLILFYLMAAFAGFVAPYHYGNQDLTRNYSPPTPVRFVLPDGSFTLRPYVCDEEPPAPEDIAQGKLSYREDPARRHALRFFVAGDEYELFGFLTCRRHLFGIDPSDDPSRRSRIYLFGADQYGRDVFSRLLYGAQISLSIGPIGILISFTIGILVGGVSGYYGGMVDHGIQRFTEVIMSLPGLYLILALRSMLPAKLSSTQTYIGIVVILAFIYWASLARVVRGMVLTIRELDFVQAAKALGAGDSRVIALHVLPGTMSYVIVQATLTIPYYILSEVFLSFLGVGIQEPQASWGNMLSEAQSIRVLTQSPWIMFSSAGAIFLTVLAYNFLGDGLRDALDPRAKPR
jgi:peptide/nickel transport system permease protein